MGKNKETIHHFHTPSKYKNPFMRFFHFLFCRKKIYFKDDDTGVCSICGEPIKTPFAYYHWGMYVAFFVISAVVFGLFLFFALPAKIHRIPYALLACGIFILLKNGITASALAFFSWETYKGEKHALEEHWDWAKQEERNRDISMLLGLGFAVVIVLTILV